jgi:transcriptional regulator with XRE-family HTH domain
MNFSQIHERLRNEVGRRIDNGSLSAALLAHRTGFAPAHISNFLNKKRKLSLDGLDKVLQSEGLTITDLFPEGSYVATGAAWPPGAMQFDSVPLVEQAVASLSMRIRSQSILEVVKVKSGLLSNLRDRCSAQRRKWDRFVAVQLTGEEADMMEPVLPENAVVLIDRHYNSTLAYAPGRRTIYALRHGNRLRFRYVALAGRHLILNTHNPAHALELLPLLEGQTSADLIVGRVFHANVDL